MNEKIVARVIIEIAGKPKEFVEKKVKEYTKKIKDEEYTEVIEVKRSPLEERETGANEDGMLKNLWMVFVEIELKFKDYSALTAFCFDYMPSSVEIIEPEEFRLTNSHLTEFFNDLQARLFQVDAVVKSNVTENRFLKVNLSKLADNMVLLLLRNNTLDIGQINRLTGIPQKDLENMMNILIEKGKIEIEGGKYSLKR